MKWARCMYTSSSLGTNVLVTFSCLFLLLFHGSSALSCFHVCIASARTGMCNIFVRLTSTTLAGGFPERGVEDGARF